MRIALELARENKAYEGLATKFFQHYIYVGAAMKRMGGRNYQLFDEDDGFFYDVLRYPDGSFEKFRVRSLVGLVPLYAIERLEEKWTEPFKEFRESMVWFLRNKAHVVQNVCYPLNREGTTTQVLAIVDHPQTRRLLDRVFDPEEFLSPYGLRSMSKAHAREPFRFGERTVRFGARHAVQVDLEVRLDLAAAQFAQAAAVEARRPAVDDAAGARIEFKATHRCCTRVRARASTRFRAAVPRTTRERPSGGDPSRRVERDRSRLRSGTRRCAARDA